MRCHFNVCSKADISQHNPPHGTHTHTHGSFHIQINMWMAMWIASNKVIDWLTFVVASVQRAGGGREA